MNLAFDAKGRLWVSGSVEYPFAAPLDEPGQDTIKILEDMDGDGRADKVTTFADGLNIPIGLYPFRNGVIAFSIPNIYFLEDTDGDDRVDRQHVLLGPFDHTRDTHGMNNAFRRGLDGWVYACHGWANQDTVTARDGSGISVEGGATFRFRPDGSRVELFTRGQVNPFGMTMNARGDLFSADCHTKPIMLLLRGGCYENFGKPHDGLGFVPSVMAHTHGSTAIAGTTVYEAESFPPEFRGNMFAGNVMTSRVNRNSITFCGSSVIAREEPDFVISNDPWFRPVDLQIGPDGALYIADFYNRIIGHYEVPLDHPGRDRERGRIWRVTYVGDDKTSRDQPSRHDLKSTTVNQLVAMLASPNLTLRLRATDELSDQRGEAAVPLLLETAQQNQSSTARAHALWVLFRLNRLASTELLKAMSDSSEFVRVHATRIAAETNEWSSDIERAVLVALNDSDGFVRRAAVDALGQHPDANAVSQLLDLQLNAPEDDLHLRHMARVALRQQLRPRGRLALLMQDDHDLDQLAVAAGVATGIDTAEAGGFLADYIASNPVDDNHAKSYAAHAARYLPPVEIERLIGSARNLSPDNLELQADLISAIDQGLQMRGLAAPKALSSWGTDVATRLLTCVEPTTPRWFEIPTSPKGQRGWPLEERLFAEGTLPEKFLSSLPLGERYTGTLRSKSFVIPSKLEFFVCGHLGPTNELPIPQNLVRLKLVSSNEEIAQCLAPRNDVAQRVTWNLQAYQGQEGYLEVVDGLKESTYAWIGVGRFDPTVLRIPVAQDLSAHRCQLALRIIARLKLGAMSELVAGVMLDESIGLETQAAAAQSFVALHPQLASAALVEQITDTAITEPQRFTILQAIATQSDESVEIALCELMQTAPERMQKALALKLAEHRDSAETLISMVERGFGAERILQDETIAQKLQLAKPDDAYKRIAKLTEDLPTQVEELNQLIERRQRDYCTADVLPTRGEMVFSKYCAACHQFRGRGATIGPQLDGIGTRGAERVIEDILDPNRNVDIGFQTSIYVLQDGRVLSGLFQRIEGELTVIADSEGKEISLPTADIDSDEKSRLSPMPSNFGALLSESEFMDLVALLCKERHSSPTSSLEQSHTKVLTGRE